MIRILRTPLLPKNLPLAILKLPNSCFDYYRKDKYFFQEMMLKIRSKLGLVCWLKDSRGIKIASIDFSIQPLNLFYVIFGG